MKRLIFVAFVILVLFSCNEFSKEDNKNVLNGIEEIQSNSVSAYPPSLPISGQNERSLSKNWNLVSFPVTVPTDLQTLFSSNVQYENVQSVWKWDNQANDWLVFPKHPDFDLLTVVTPDDGYWVKARRAFDFEGVGVSVNAYSFAQGWNLIGYSHSNSSISIEDFFSNGDFWADSCGTGEPVISAWAWANHTWQVYFPSENGLADFNAAQGTNFQALETLEAGQGLWVNASRNNYPPKEGGCPNPDITAPILNEITFIPNPTNDNTPDYIFSSSESGNITYGGSCSSETISAVEGNNTITFETLSDGSYENCSIIVTDNAGNTSNILSVSSFTIDTNPPLYTSLTPLGTGANLNTQLTIHFTEQVVKGEGVLNLFELNNDELKDTIGLADVELSQDGLSASFDFDHNLEHGKDYYVKVHNGVFKDLADNDFPSIEKGFWNFKTIEPETVVDLGQTISNTLIIQLQIRISGVSSSDNITTTLKDTVSADYLFEKDQGFTDHLYPNGDGLVLTHNGTTFSILADFSSITLNTILPYDILIEVYNENNQIAKVEYTQNGTFEVGTLTIVKDGTGTGTISSDQEEGIECGNDCSEDYHIGQIVPLIASPDNDSSLTDWSPNDCDDSSENCDIYMDSDKTITVTFTSNTTSTTTTTEVTTTTLPTPDNFIRVNFVAEIEYVDDPENILNGTIKVDDQIEGYYTYATNAIDTNEFEQFGTYNFTEQGNIISLKTGGYHFYTDPNNVFVQISTSDNYNNNDTFHIQSDKILSNTEGVYISHISWQLDDNSQTALDSTDLPQEAPNLEDWQQVFGLSIDGRNTEEEFDPEKETFTFFIRAKVISAEKEAN